MISSRSSDFGEIALDSGVAVIYHNTMKKHSLLLSLLSLVLLPDAAAETPGFAVDMFRHVVQEQPGNVVFSPASVEGVLRLLKQGARGETARELEQLRMPQRSLTSGMQVAEANALFVDKSLQLKPGIKVDEVIPTPLCSDVVKSADMVNAWADKNTRGMIPAVIEPADLAGGDCKLLAANAIALEEKWRTPFDPEATEPTVFHAADGSKPQVPMMYKTDKYLYAEDADWKAVALYYRSHDRHAAPGCFISILPEGNAREFVDSLTPEKFESICKALRETRSRRVQLGMPRIEQRTGTFSLSMALRACGVNRIFTPMADLTGFADAPLYLSEMLQRCYVKADEQGTKAAAVTVGVIRSFSMRPEPTVPFIMDRPFIWTITELENQGSPYFMGLCEKP